LCEKKPKRRLTPNEKRFVDDIRAAIKRSGLNQGEYARKVLGLKSGGSHLSMILNGLRLSEKTIMKLAPKAGFAHVDYIDFYDPNQIDRRINDKSLNKWPFFKHLIRAINDEDVESILKNLESCKNTLEKK